MYQRRKRCTNTVGLETQDEGHYVTNDVFSARAANFSVCYEIIARAARSRHPLMTMHKSNRTGRLRVGLNRKNSPTKEMEPWGPPKIQYLQNQRFCRQWTRTHPMTPSFFFDVGTPSQLPHLPVTDWSSWSVVLDSRGKMDVSSLSGKRDSTAGLPGAGGGSCHRPGRPFGKEFDEILPKGPPRAGQLARQPLGVDSKIKI